MKFTGTATGATMGIGATTDVIALATTGASVTGQLDVGTSGARNFVVTSAGDTTITGTLGVTGATQLTTAKVSSTLEVTGGDHTQRGRVHDEDHCCDHAHGDLAHDHERGLR